MVERSALRRASPIVFSLVGVAFMVVAFRRALRGTQESLFPSAPRALLAFTLICLGLVAAERGWRVLVGEGNPRSLARAFFTAQIGKYIPGGVWQLVGQVDLTTQAGVPPRTAMVALPVHAVVQVVAAGIVGAFLSVTGRDMAPEIRIGALAGFGSVLFLSRGWMQRVTRLMRQDAGLIPAQRSILIATGWSIVTLIVSGAAFGLLGLRTIGAVGMLPMISAFSIAWAVGFLALPFPSGIGVREAVLMVLLGDAASVVAVAVVHRLITMAAEGTMMVAIRTWRDGSGE